MAVVRRRHHPARRRRDRLLDVPDDGPLRRGHVRELGERVPADGRVRAAHDLPRPEGLERVEAGRRRPARRGPTPASRRPRRTVARPARRGVARRLRAQHADRVHRALRRHVRRPRCLRRPRVQRRATRARPTGARHVAVRADVRVLVPVVPELAERVPRRGRDRRAVGLPAPARLGGVEAGARAATGRRATTDVGQPHLRRRWATMLR